MGLPALLRLWHQDVCGFEGFLVFHQDVCGFEGFLDVGARNLDTGQLSSRIRLPAALGECEELVIIPQHRTDRQRLPVFTSHSLSLLQ